MPTLSPSGASRRKYQRNANVCAGLPISHRAGAMSLLRCLHPATWLLNAQSQSGKTYTMIKILRNLEYLYGRDVSFSHIVWFYGSKESLAAIPSDLRMRMKFVHGVPESLTPFLALPGNKIFIFDDVFVDAFNSKEVANLVTRGVHHNSVTVFVCSQATFSKDKFARLINLQAHYILQWPNARDYNEFRYLSQQLMPDNSRTLVAAFRDTTCKPRTYWFIDLHPMSPAAPWGRFRQNIFPDEEFCSVFVPKSCIDTVPFTDDLK